MVWSGRRLSIFGGHILRGMADAISDPGEGHFLRGFADALSGQGTMSVSNGVLSVTDSNGATFQENIQVDPATGQSFVIDPSTGQQIFVDPVTGQPLPSNALQAGNSASPQSGIQFDQFGQAFVIDPVTGEHTRKWCNHVNPICIIYSLRFQDQIACWTDRFACHWKHKICSIGRDLAALDFWIWTWFSSDCQALKLLLIQTRELQSIKAPKFNLISSARWANCLHHMHSLFNISWDTLWTSNSV